MINENISKIAWKNVHMGDYIENSDTDMWLAIVKGAKEIIYKNELMTDLEKQNAVDKYKRKTAEWINADRLNNSRHVSQFICGAGNYNMNKHTKFLERERKLMNQYNYIFDVDNYIKHMKIKNEIIQDIEYKEYEIGDIKVIQNTDINRLQLKFNGKPDEKIREVLKNNGFKWSPKNSTWQRQLTKNAIIKLNEIKNLF